MINRPKVFGIGFHKTGTSSLGLALKHLGYRVGGPNGVREPLISQESALQMAFRLVDEYEYNAFKDNPWPIIYRELDAQYPGSKFILTIRPTKEWISSAVRHFDTHYTPMRKWIYGVGYPKGNEEIYVARYERHNREVMAYFQDRPHDLLILNLAEGNGWEKLCRFLEKEGPTIPFPHANQKANRRNRKRRARETT
jgi:hypothetical protein